MALRWKIQPPLSELLPKIEAWYQTEQGASVLASEYEMVSRSLAGCFGYYLLQLSINRHCNLVDQCRIQRKFQGHPMPGDSAHHVVTRFDQLPFATDSLDCVVLHHVQEFVANPHDVLREMQRVILPRGHLVVTGFNPWSMLGLRMAGSRVLPGMTWHNHLLPHYRMIDWMELLGFQVSSIRYGHCNPAFRRIGGWPFGGVYVIDAVKQVAALSPPKKRWKAPSPSFGLVTAKPTANIGFPSRNKTRREVA